VPSSHLNKGNNHNILIYAFKNFLRAICSETQPVVLFLDDLQWADDPSSNILADLLTDQGTRHFMFIGAYMSNLVDDDHPFSQRRMTIEKARDVVRIDLVGLSLKDITAFITDTLGSEIEKTKSLADAIYEKSGGNIFFTMQVLEELRRREVLYIS
jgi:predicted ATPase